MDNLQFGVGSSDGLKYTFQNIIGSEPNFKTVFTGYQQLSSLTPGQRDSINTASAPSLPQILSVTWSMGFPTITEYETHDTLIRQLPFWGVQPLIWAPSILTERRWVYARCSSVSVDRSSKGTAPFLTTYTATFTTELSFWQSFAGAWFIGEEGIILNEGTYTIRGETSYTNITGPTTINIQNIGSNLMYPMITLTTIPDTLVGAGPFGGGERLTLKVWNSVGALVFRATLVPDFEPNQSFTLNGLTSEFTKIFATSNPLPAYADWDVTYGTGLLPLSPGPNRIEIGGRNITNFVVSLNYTQTWS